MATGTDTGAGGTPGAFIRLAGAAPVVEALGLPVAFPAEGTDTGGRLGVEQAVMPPGADFPPHFHRTYDEAFYVLEGEVTLVLGDQTAAAPAGSFGFAPRGTVHTVRNPGTAPARLLVVTVPAARTKAAFQELSALPSGLPDMARVGAILQRYDINPAGPPAAQ